MKMQYLSEVTSTHETEFVFFYRSSVNVGENPISPMLSFFGSEGIGGEVEVSSVFMAFLGAAL